jgi:hypothetical protein
MITISIYEANPETGTPRGYRTWENPPADEARPAPGRDVEPPRGPFMAEGEADLRSSFQEMDRQTAQRLVDEADDRYAPGSPDTLGQSWRSGTRSRGPWSPRPPTKSAARTTAATW